MKYIIKAAILQAFNMNWKELYKNIDYEYKSFADDF